VRRHRLWPRREARLEGKLPSSVFRLPSNPYIVTMAKHNLLGERGETIAYDYLLQKGYKIVERNWRHRKAEIDLIAWDDKTLVFIEVKTRSNELFGKPEVSVDDKKEILVIAAAQAYMESIDYEWAIRFDIISIVVHNAAAARIQHFEDAFPD